MINKKYLIILTLFLFSFSFVYAQASQVYETDPQLRAYTIQGYLITPIMISEGIMNEDIYINFRVYDENGALVEVTDDTVNCSAFMFSPKGKRVYRFDGNEELSNISLTGRQAMFPGSFFNESGYYKWFIGCEHKLTNDGGAFQGETLVTLSGKALETKDILSRFSLILFFGLLIFFIYTSTNKINFENWYKKIKEKYKNRNYVKLALSSIGYQLIKNRWIIFYTIGFAIIVLLMDITYIFSIESIFTFMKVLTFIYSWSFILVGLVFLSYLQEFFKMIIEQIEEDNWGGIINE